MIRHRAIAAAAGMLAVALPAWTGRGDAPRCTADVAAASGPLLGVTGLDPTDFERQTGLSAQMLHIYVQSRHGWEPLRGLGSGGRLDAVKSALEKHPDTTVLISYPPIPARLEGPPAEALAKCVRGDFDDHYAAYGAGLAERQLDRVILRVGWEWDSDFAWGAERDVGQARLFAACFERVAEAMRGAFPGNHLRFDWNSTASVTPELLDAGYPGDAVVDVVSVEGYDGRGGSDPADRWAATKQAFDLVSGFGRGRGKPLAIPEWSILTHHKNPRWGGGDNPNHIEKVCAYAKAPENNVLYHIYFDRANELADHLLANHPASLEAFRANCGPRPPAC